MTAALSPQHHVAADLLVERMRLAFAQNPRGERYRTLPMSTLFSMLQQNVSELELALSFNNDVEDKLADVANYCSFLYRNHVDPAEQDNELPTYLVGLDRGQAVDVITRLMRAHGLTRVEV